MKTWAAFRLTRELLTFSNKGRTSFTSEEPVAFWARWIALAAYRTAFCGSILSKSSKNQAQEANMRCLSNCDFNNCEIRFDSLFVTKGPPKFVRQDWRSNCGSRILIARSRNRQGSFTRRLVSSTKILSMISAVAFNASLRGAFHSGWGVQAQEPDQRSNSCMQLQEVFSRISIQSFGACSIKPKFRVDSLNSSHL